MGVSKKNSPCPCGSGKKYKQCCRKKNIQNNKKKPRYQAITMDMGEKVAVNGYRMGPNGQVELLVDGKPITPISAHCSTFFKREKKEKVLSRVPVNPTEMIINPIPALMDFDLITAIDTNSIEHNGNKISVACAAICKLSQTDDGVTAQFAPVEAYEFWNSEGNPETLAWAIHIDQIIRSEGYHDRLKVGIVTDSELGNHDSFNARRTPIRDDFLLPENYTLMYGSADRGNELPNILIKSCDKWATKIIQKIKAEDELPKLHEGSGTPYTHSRHWGDLGSANFLE